MTERKCGVCGRIVYDSETIGVIKSASGLADILCHADCIEDFERRFSEKVEANK